MADRPRRQGDGQQPRLLIKAEGEQLKNQVEDQPAPPLPVQPVQKGPDRQGGEKHPRHHPGGGRHPISPLDPQWEQGHHDRQHGAGPEVPPQNVPDQQDGGHIQSRDQGHPQNHMAEHGAPEKVVRNPGQRPGGQNSRKLLKGGKVVQPRVVMVLDIVVQLGVVPQPEGAVPDHHQQKQQQEHPRRPCPVPFLPLIHWNRPLCGPGTPSPPPGEIPWPDAGPAGRTPHFPWESGRRPAS